jgi:hypothetical protein
VDAYWEDLNYISPNVLGGARAIDYLANFTGAPMTDIWYPLALASRLAGTDLDPGQADIDASFNCSFPGWYFGTDGNLSTTEYDFVSVVLHEIGHGLGFSGSMQVSGQTGSWGAGTGKPVIYDRFAVNGSGQSLLSNYANNSTALAGQLKSNNLFFSGAQAMAANGGNKPKLYAPATWQQGSSYSHLDENTYSITSGNALMTPSLYNGEVLHDPGPIALGIFDDLGWSADIDLAASNSTAGRLNASPVSLSQLISRNSPAQRTYACNAPAPSPTPTPPPAPKENSTYTYLPAIWNLPAQ